MAMTTTPALYATSGSGGGTLRNTGAHHRYTINVAPGQNSSHHHHHRHHRKSAVELLAESKAFYVKSETVRGRTQTLPLLSHNRRHRANTISNVTSVQPGLLQSGLREPPVMATATLNRRSTGTVAALSHQSNADMLQNALRKLLDCGSPQTSIENVATNQSSTSVSNDISFDMDCTTPISPPAEYAFCASSSERRYTTRSLSHSQPVSASSTRSGETSSSNHPHENGCCSAHLMALAKSLPDLHTARNLSSSFEGSRSNKSVTSDVFSLNRDSGGDSSGHLTHKSEPVTRRYVPPVCLGTGGNTINDNKHWANSTPVNSDLRRDSGSSTQHSGSYYHNVKYYDQYHLTSYSQDHPKKVNRHGGYYEKNSPGYETEYRPNYFCRITKHGYPVPMNVARTELVQTSNDSRTVLQNVRNVSSSSSSGVNRNSNCTSSSSSSNKNKNRSSAAQIEQRTLSANNQLLFESPTNELILPPPIECSDLSHENIVFMDTIIPPPVFENEQYVEHKEMPDYLVPPPPITSSTIEACSIATANDSKYKYSKSSSTICDKDNISDSSFHENVAHHNQVYRQHCKDTILVQATTTTHVITTKTNICESGPTSLPFVDPELSPGLGTFKRQKCFRFKQKPASRPILRSKSDISDRYRRNSKSTSGALVRKSCGGEISRSVSHLEQFFEQLGLNSDAYDNIFVTSGDSGSDSPVYFSDVSTVDSNRPIPPIAVPDCVTEGNNNELIVPNNATTQLGTSNNIFRSSSDQPSIVERNARIIKWLCNCRKAQLAPGK